MLGGNVGAEIVKAGGFQYFMIPLGVSEILVFPVTSCFLLFILSEGRGRKVVVVVMEVCGDQMPQPQPCLPLIFPRDE